MAEIVFIGESSWSIIDHSRRETGLLAYSPLTSIDCPVVDVTPVQDDQALAKLIRQHVRPLGLQDAGELITGLLKLGAIVTYPSSNITVAEDHIVEEIGR